MIISAVRKACNREAETILIENTLDGIQQEIQGSLVSVFPHELREAGVMMYANEEGWIRNLPVNIYDERHGPIRGTVLFVTTESQYSDPSGFPVDLTEEQKIRIARYLDYSFVSADDSEILGNLRYGYGLV